MIPSPETEEREVTLDWVEKNTRYFILDKKERKTIAVCWIQDKNRQSGYQFYERRTGWEFNPFKIGSCLVDWWLDQTGRYDITSNFEESVKNCNWNEVK